MAERVGPAFSSARSISARLLHLPPAGRYTLAPVRRCFRCCFALQARASPGQLVSHDEPPAAPGQRLTRRRPDTPGPKRARRRHGSAAGRAYFQAPTACHKAPTPCLALLGHQESRRGVCLLQRIKHTGPLQRARPGPFWRLVLACGCHGSERPAARRAAPMLRLYLTTQPARHSAGPHVRGHSFAAM